MGFEQNQNEFLSKCASNHPWFENPQLIPLKMSMQLWIMIWNLWFDQLLIKAFPLKQKGMHYWSAHKDFNSASQIIVCGVQSHTLSKIDFIASKSNHGSDWKCRIANLIAYPSLDFITWQEKCLESTVLVNIYEKLLH